MKKRLAVFTIVAALSVAGSAFAARGGMGVGQGMGPGNCPQMGQPTALTDQQKKFIADTMPLREEMHSKHMELQKEMIKEKPDAAAVTRLQGEVRALHQKMIEARTKAGFPPMGGKTGKKGKMGRGMQQGMGPGCGPCMQMGPAMTPPPAAAPAK